MKIIKNKYCKYYFMLYIKIIIYSIYITYHLVVLNRILAIWCMTMTQKNNFLSFIKQNLNKLKIKNVPPQNGTKYFENFIKYWK